MPTPLNQYYTISSSVLLSTWGIQNFKLDESIRLNVLLKNPSTLTPALFEILNSIKNNYIISLSQTFINEKDILQKVLPKLYLLTTLNSCDWGNVGIIPIFFNSITNPCNFNTDIITGYFHIQGVENIKFPLFDTYNKGKDIQYSEECSFIMYSLKERKYLLQSSVDDPFRVICSNLTIIYFEDEIDDITRFHEIIHLIDDTNHYDQLKIYFSYFSEHFVAKRIFEEEKRLWKKRVLLYQDFLFLSKKVQETEYYEIIEWYNKEYEILPLWYKRIGHVIKVLMGKRTFRSLFDNNVKKYKD